MKSLKNRRINPIGHVLIHNSLLCRVIERIIEGKTRVGQLFLEY